MVTRYGKWIEEKDYASYPKEKLCWYDLLAIWIRDKGYEPKTSMENLISNMFIHFDGEIEMEQRDFHPEPYSEKYIECCKEYVEASGGISEFDYEV